MYYHGIERVSLADGILTGKRIGLVTNYTALDRGMNRTLDILNDRYPLVRVFSPEHGLSGVAQAGEKVGNGTDKKSGLPVVSLYGGTSENDERFDGLDAVAFDIQDIGLRFYTYISVLAEVMRTCAGKRIPLVVFDRFNPLGLGRREGTYLDERFSSFIGKYALPSRHGLTVGEYARYINSEKNIGCDLTVIPCDGLQRCDDWRTVGRPWVYPSPNIPSYDTAVAYAGTVVFEGTNVSEGRGTTRPFSLIGAPWIDGDVLAERMNARRIPGVILRSAEFRPTFSKHAGECCRGVEILITDYDAFEPVRFGLTLADTIRHDCPEIKINNYMCHILGTDEFESPDYDTDEFLAAEKKKIDAFGDAVRKYELYPHIK